MPASPLVRSRAPAVAPPGSTSLETAHRTRALITIDTRQQTAYGTLRTYILLGYSQDSTAPESTSPAVYMTRGFLQIAGFTFGKATSFFDIVPGASFAYNAGMFHHPDTGDAGKMLAAYTAQFGNGLSGTIALEQARVRGIARVPGSAYAISANPLGTFIDGGIVAGVSEYPDLVGNIRLDQSWGTWLVGAAAPRQPWPVLRHSEHLATRVHRTHKLGWAVTTGFIWNLPMIAPGDRLSAGIVYSEGAIGYASVTPSGAPSNKFEGASFGTGFWEDAIYNGGITPAGPCGALVRALAAASGGCGNLQLTTAWSVSAAFEHLWTPALKTSIYGSYIDVSHNAAANFLICNAGGGIFPATTVAAGVVNFSGCNADWSSLERRFAHAVGAG